MLYFKLHACCIAVNGFSRSTICDIQRDKIFFIPNILYDILIEHKNKAVEEIIEFYGDEHSEDITEYFEYLIENELGFYSSLNEIKQFPNIETQLNDSKQIKTSIIDINKSSKLFNVKIMVSQLSDLGCEAVEIRFFSNIDFSELKKIFDYFENTTIRSLEILVPFNNDFSIFSKEEWIKFRLAYARLKKVTIYNSPEEIFYENHEFSIFYTKQHILSEMDCGKICQENFNCKTEFYVESKNKNNCLNKKISLDTNGKIKNCPSMNFDYGNIENTKLNDIINDFNFKKYWNITKDHIETCKICEFRYVCMDCRAFVKNPNDIFSKPLKCNYNPYENNWFTN